MTQRTPITLAALLLAIPALSALPAHAQLPATAPTAMPAPIAATPTVTHGRKAYVTFVNGQLNVRADNSSLNVILREISRKTGMTITGGVADDRVFGNYGPADPGTVIATLLGGSGVNILFRADDHNNPTELILTPRTGGATPPSPTSSQFDEEAQAEEAVAAPVPPAPQPATTTTYTNQPTVSNTDYNPNNSRSASSTPVPNPNASPVTTPVSIPQPINNVNGSSANTTPSASEIPTVQSVPVDSLPTPSTTPSSTGIVDSPNQAPAGTTVNPAGVSATSVTTAPDGTTTTTTVTSPNGVLTPEDIAAKLMKMQQAAQAAAQPKTSGTTTPATTPQQ